MSMTMPVKENRSTRTESGFNALPASAGIGLKPQHFRDILEYQPAVGWFEAHPENYMVAGGPLHHYLEKIVAQWPLSFHSVAMSLGSVDGVDHEHLQRLRELCERYQPSQVSDHLSWSRWRRFALNDLLPMPYTGEALDLMRSNLMQVQDALGRSIAVENPSSYFDVSNADLSEAQFLVELVESCDADILLDINNIYVSACNHGWSALDYLDLIPPDLVCEIHLAGHSLEETGAGPLRIDDHGSNVAEEVWQLFEVALARLGPKPVLIEWDTNIPELAVLESEALRAQRVLNQRMGSRIPGQGILEQG